MGLVWVIIVVGGDLFLERLKEELRKRGNPWIAGETEIAKDTVFRRLWIEKGTTGIREKGEEGGVSKISGLAKERIVLGIKFPTSLDWRDQGGKNYITSVKHQGWCGSCWAFAACGMLEGRLNIAYNTPGKDRDLSEQFLVSCDIYDDGCCGGNAYDYLKFLKEVGVPDDECFPYQDSRTDVCTKKTNHPCEKRCSDWEDRVIKIVDYGVIVREGVTTERLKAELLNGPVPGAFYFKRRFFLL